MNEFSKRFSRRKCHKRSWKSVAKVANPRPTQALDYYMPPDFEPLIAGLKFSALAALVTGVIDWAIVDDDWLDGAKDQ